MKRCTKCHEQRDAALFAPDERMRDGLSSWCRLCYRELSRVYRQQHPRSSSQAHKQYRREHPELLIYRDMIRRCGDPRRSDFAHYGGRGVRVCESWLSSFDAFLADMGPRPSGDHSVERIDNNRGYEPGNCRWATTKEQRRNTRRTRLITANGKTQCMSAWAEELGAPPRLIHQRITMLGWSPERAVTVPAPGRKAS